jgi:hypothetical protein
MRRVLRMSSPSPEPAPNLLEMARADGRVTLNIEECGILLGVSRATAFAMAANGTLPVMKVGPRRFIVPIAAFEAMLANAGVQHA